MRRARSIIRQACDPEHLTLFAATALVIGYLLLVWILPEAM